MARRKGQKRWNEMSREEWLAFFKNPDVMTDLVMDIFRALYHAPGHEAGAKRIASAMGVEYRALNAAAGWAGTKIRAWYEAEKGESGEKRAPWEYVFDGAEEEDGTYLWILKPAAISAWRELEEAAPPERGAAEAILAGDVSAFGREGSLFALAPAETVKNLRRELAEERAFSRRSLAAGTRCTVCGTGRASLLRAYPYGEGGRKHRGLLFCPTHGALFAAHLISFGPKGTLLVSESLSDADREALGLREGEAAKNPFSGRRMAVHRRIFNERRRNDK